MIIIADVLIIFLLFFGLFGISHTLFASDKIKKRIIEKAGTKIAFYRLFFNLISVLIFITIYEISPKPKSIIYDLKYPFDIIIFISQIFAGIGLLWSSYYVDWKEFIGVSQIIRYLKGTYNIEEMDERSTLIIKGPFKFIRHPVYFFSILFLGLRPTMNLFYLSMYLSLIIYFIIGSYYEERKLVNKFGDIYLEYQKNVPVIPFIKGFKHYEK